MTSLPTFSTASLPRRPADPQAAEKMKQLFFPIREQLALAEERFRRELKNPHPFVDELASYGSMLGGKRLRPALLLLAAKSCGEIEESHLVLSAVVEMIHTATLVHDDVLDEADTRRHLATVHSRWSNQASVLLGDYLFTHAFYLASTLETTFACRVIGRATNIVCEGELRQIGSQGRFDLSEQEYFSIIEAKTAELCACCCQLGAHFSGADAELVAALESYGRNLGIAFQIADDLLDITGEEGIVGKSLGTDLAQLKPTLPLIHALTQAEEEQRQHLFALLEAGEPESLSEICTIMRESGSTQYTRQTALDFAARAAESLHALPDSDARNVLAALCHFVVDRPC